MLVFAVSMTSNSFADNPENPLLLNLEYSTQSMGVNFYIQASDQNTIKVKIRNQDREIVFQKTLHGSKQYKGVLNFEQMSDGSYFIEVRQYHQKIVRQIDLSQTSLRTVSLK